MAVFNINSLFFLALLFFLNQNCNHKNNSNIETINNINLNQIDSLKSEGYMFTKKIDFFSMIPQEYINPSNELHFFAFKKVNNLISIINFKNGEIFMKRELKKYSSNFYMEERIIDSSDGGEMHYVNYYYSENKIVITVITENIFVSNKLNCYLDFIFIIEKNSVTHYSYRYNNSLHLNGNFNLSNEQLLDIDNLALSLFYNKENVNIYKFPFSSFSSEICFVWDINTFY